jgi:hypothetical protein
MLLPAAKRVTLREAHEEPAPTPRRPVPSGGAG